MGTVSNVAARVEGIVQSGGITSSEDAWRQSRVNVAVNFLDAERAQL
jgi:hypothetical protein